MGENDACGSFLARMFGASKDVAVLSYRWRIRGNNENIKDYKQWLADCAKEGYSTFKLDTGREPVDWSLADGHMIQIEVAAWLLWLYTNKVAEYAWVDQMCVPQDASIEVKMKAIKESPAIYRDGKVYVVLAPVVDYASGRIMLGQDARQIVDSYSGAIRGYSSRAAVKALLVNNSYMRRVWTIQEAVAAQDLTVWPLKGRGEVNSYQPLRVMDWPEFNGWNSHPQLGPLYLKYTDAPLNDYYEGDYTGVIKNLRDKVSDAIAYLAMISKDLMWITMDRNGLVNDVKKADTAAKRAWVVLNNHQIQSARSFLPEDKVLALVPLIDYGAWKKATFGVPGRHLVQASVDWAYGLASKHIPALKWSIRIYNAPRCAARGLELLQPRRNLGDSSSMHGATPGWQLEIPEAGRTLTLSPPARHVDGSVAAWQSSSGALNAQPLQLRVEALLLMPHPGQAKFWGGGPWTHIRDALRTDEVFRLSVQWGLEPWRHPDLRIQTDKCAVAVVSGGGLPNPLMIVAALSQGDDSTGQVMVAVEVDSGSKSALLGCLRTESLGNISGGVTLVSSGVSAAK
ncbi:hypothetical protein GPECTOR_15g488 [Gonium pectorale]|uniref:Heterokaryon incompatibility domain-containing protein n=1 Tax=Gonium pectorale TaxID=33097 RepID=A0A150GM08_GONPE|nr:hypothetical protein GPECTOR_15g488 [Gonium pectorale]|eukprot:KXZ50802.1 hypothetical protein GPECTOR_15g488 [Gonium pectorale]